MRWVFDSCLWIERRLRESLALTWIVRGTAGELCLEIIGSEDGYFNEEELARDATRFAIVEDSPDRNLREEKNRLVQVYSAGEGSKGLLTRSSSCLRACSTTPSWPLSTIHIRLRSRISVEHTTSESMLKPRAAKIPDTRDKTPGSFCTRQLRTCLGEVTSSAHIIIYNVFLHYDSLRERLQAWRRGVVQNVRHSFLRSPRTW